jgi:hypothetical protein
MLEEDQSLTESGENFDAGEVYDQAGSTVYTSEGLEGDIGVSPETESDTSTNNFGGGESYDQFNPSDAYEEAADPVEDVDTLPETTGIDRIEPSSNEVDTDNPSEAYDQAGRFANAVESSRKEILSPAKQAALDIGTSVIDSYTPSRRYSSRSASVDHSSESLGDAFKQDTGLVQTVRNFLG